MASMIWIGSREQLDLKSCQTANVKGYNNPLPKLFRPVIAKGNIIEGIEAKY